MDDHKYNGPTLFPRLVIEPSRKIGELWAIDGWWGDKNERLITGPWLERDVALDTILHQYKHGARDFRLLQLQVIGAETIRHSKR